MYWNPDFFMCSCAYYVWLWMTFPSLSYFFHLSLFPSFSSSKCNCWKVKKNPQFSMGKCICNIQLYCAVTIHQLRLLVLVQHTFDVHKTSDSDSIFFTSYRKHIWLVKKVFFCNQCPLSSIWQCVTDNCWYIQYRNLIQKIFDFNICAFFQIRTRIMFVIYGHYILVIFTRINTLTSYFTHFVNSSYDVQKVSFVNIHISFRFPKENFCR